MATAVRKITADFHEKLAFLFEPWRYKVLYGGRAGLKSWGAARGLLIQGMQKKHRVLCTRETQSSIRESVHQLLDEQIKLLGLGDFYDVQQNTIVGANGTEFVFGGLRQNANNLKSYESCDRAWVEEAQTVTKRSLDDLIPTIFRNKDAEIWITFNPVLATDEVYKRFVTDPPPADEAKVVFTSYHDNHWLPERMMQEIADCRRRSEEDYQHIYEGVLRQVVDGAIYRQEIADAEKNEQFCRVPYDPTVPVNTFWDLGFADNTSIWFEQSIGFEFRFIDHLTDSLQSLGYYLKKMQERGYTYGTHFLPWDGDRAEQGSGRSIKEQMQAVFGKENVRCVKKLPVTDGIAAVRAIFPKSYFDSEKCAEGLNSLRHYRYAYDEKLLTFQREPLHDWASHDADALRTAAVGVKEQERPKEKEQEAPRGYSSYGRGASGAWMES